MKTLLTIKEQDINPEAPVIDPSQFSTRKAARAIVQKEKGEVALLHVAKYNYHKLPGGGVEEGEDLITALDRELLEEIGYHAEVIAEVGEIVEYWDQNNEIQTSYCYLAKPGGELQAPKFTDNELEGGFKAEWAKSIDEAITILEADQPTNYDGKHIKPRDLAFLKAAKKLFS